MFPQSSPTAAPERIESELAAHREVLVAVMVEPEVAEAGLTRLYWLRDRIGVCTQRAIDLYRNSVFAARWNVLAECSGDSNDRVILSIPFGSAICSH